MINLVFTILGCVLRVVASVSLQVVTPLIAGIASVLVELLVCIFVDLKAGIFGAITPEMRTALLAPLPLLPLDIVAEVIRKGTN
ncbi:hypothetical protein H0H87_004865 [Tephrocybe sp. NHM501043]|nr:hypothetical protein H0H87_004865 [Tephrocybe sp. NHM501043]